ncbi:ATP-dependent helicase [Gallibacterium genomosp. 3]|uniref:RNA polymerase-associated protein RapA n=1 Tax=Gallibacterium genomosp. 3 TaxID=505345 RepID=A0A1A7NTH9_9PAST|nr:RNA polymerase-associated protein RapA [Gallibacterium genomosp. 3]OBW92963.1 ATP-dependent helicase [Gallibacterium genomosp. 3]
MSFTIGQRWISESENNLGLGLVTAVDNRTVTFLFPAADETRVYSVAAAPMTRVLFQIGDTISHHEGWQAEVIDVMENHGIALYLAKNLTTQQEVVIKEIELAHQITFSKPQDRLFSAQIDRNDRFSLRYQALQHQQQQFQSPLRGLRGTRASLIPHQLHIAQEVGSRLSPRVLLADEVGLGKTLEAGMILQQQLFSGRVQRVFILVPETLQHQWLVEMLRRFNLNFSLFDEERCQDFDRKDEDGRSIKVNPFDSESLVICSLDWLVTQPNRMQEAIDAQWDMLIVDEAHHLQWHVDAPSEAYRFVEKLAERTPSVLLLTATPEQLGQESHFARLRLLDPNRFYDYNAFIAEQKSYRPVADAVNSLLSEHKLSNEEQNTLTELLAEQDIEPLLRVINGANSHAEQIREAKNELMANLVDRHGTSRLLFRNTRQAVKGFPKRILHQIKLELPKQYANAQKVVNLLNQQNKHDSLYPEMIFQQLNQDAAWWEFDPRIEWLLTFLKNHNQEKVLVICQQTSTVLQLEKILREKEGIRSTVFHEKMSIVERDRAAAYFAQQEDGAKVLLSSSIGSEGRNFQFASRLVLFNLPLNPDVLEQSIGRLDRIGQNKDIQIYVPYFNQTPQMVLMDWYQQGLGAFEQTCPMGATLFAKYGSQLQDFLTTSELDSEQFNQFIEKVATEKAELQQELEQGRDRLLELNSNGGEHAQQLAADIEQQDGQIELINFCLNLFDVIGLEQEDLGEDSIVIQPTGHMLVPDFPGLKEDGSTVTFNRQLALAREDLEFLTWDHPMVRNGIDLITSGDIGKTAVSLLPHKGLPAGTLLLELIYVVEAQAPKELQLTRFLPPTPVRLLLDIKGNDLAPQVSFKGLEKQLKPINKNVANKMVKMTKSDVERLIKLSQTMIEPKAAEIIQQATENADKTLYAELNRLTALQAVNKNIRPDEITQLEQLIQQSLHQLKAASWRLDSLRVIISNKE